MIPAGRAGLFPCPQSAGLVPALVPCPERANRRGPNRALLCKVAFKLMGISAALTLVQGEELDFVNWTNPFSSKYKNRQRLGACEERRGEATPYTGIEAAKQQQGRMEKRRKKKKREKKRQRTSPAHTFFFP